MPQPQQQAQPNSNSTGFNWVITESYAAYSHSIFMSIQKKNPIILDGFFSHPHHLSNLFLRKSLGVEARNYLMQAGLSVTDLALIWSSPFLSHRSLELLLISLRSLWSHSFTLI